MYYPNRPTGKRRTHIRGRQQVCEETDSAVINLQKHYTFFCIVGIYTNRNVSKTQYESN
jgi:hypothetical protein